MHGNENGSRYQGRPPRAPATCLTLTASNQRRASPLAHMQMHTSRHEQPSCDLRPSLRALGPDGAFRAGLRSAFNLDPSDVAPLRLSAIGGCAIIFAYGIASPLLEVVALSLGMDILPLVTAGQTLLMFAVNPLYQYAQRRMLPTELIGIAYRLMAGMLLALEALATAWPHRRAVAYCLAVYGGIIATYPPALYD